MPRKAVDKASVRHLHAGSTDSTATRLDDEVRLALGGAGRDEERQEEDRGYGEKSEGPHDGGKHGFCGWSSSNVSLSSQGGQGLLSFPLDLHTEWYKGGGGERDNVIIDRRVMETRLKEVGINLMSNGMRAQRKSGSVSTDKSNRNDYFLHV